MQMVIDFMWEDVLFFFFVYLFFVMFYVFLYLGKDFEGQFCVGIYGDVVEEIDDVVGCICVALEEVGMVENIFILFISDNGLWIIKGVDGGLVGYFWDGKGSIWEGGMWVLGIVCWLGIIVFGQVQCMFVNMMDWYMILLGFVGQDIFEDWIVDGGDFCFFLCGEMFLDCFFFYYGFGNQL